MTQFTVDIAKFVDQLGPHLNTLLQNIGFECAENIIVGGAYSPGTPVDTGYARASWYVGINGEGEPHQGPQRPTKRTAGGASGGNIQDIAKSRLGDSIMISSNAEYIGALEFGHSKQAPNGMIRLTLEAGQLIADKIAVQMGWGN